MLVLGRCIALPTYVLRGCDRLFTRQWGLFTSTSCALRLMVKLSSTTLSSVVLTDDWFKIPPNFLSESNRSPTGFLAPPEPFKPASSFSMNSTLRCKNCWSSSHVINRLVSRADSIGLCARGTVIIFSNSSFGLVVNFWFLKSICDEKLAGVHSFRNLVPQFCLVSPSQLVRILHRVEWAVDCDWTPCRTRDIVSTATTSRRWFLCELRSISN